MNDDFSSREYWNLRYKHAGNSGLGSYGDNAAQKADFVNQVISKYQINSIIELGCGDGNQLDFYNFKKYTGFDISEDAVQRCKDRFSQDQSKKFVHLTKNFTDFKNGLVEADLALSSEVIFHLVEDQVFEEYMLNLFSVAKKYALIISTNHDENKDSPSWVKHRIFTNYISNKFPDWKFIKGFKTTDHEIMDLYGKYFFVFIKKGIE